ncbi:ATP-binding protein [Amycolatopsis sp. FBCC-B4732]|uniref:ATP/GTP-binding protein n=1 Tax=Amycolatopsis sp. FBCC-B4732 TaxID=3079339 RepID=UPI001FF64D33|nr:ATP-binding protein [Amycolatopsis sp. FBCC-B4732]UOX90980.1 ATP-binding protein [Amycolatopsis sp. FBCC-B4732]
MTDNEPKIIAFIGAGCVGKTTLFEAYRTRFAGDDRVSFAAEAAKQYFSTHEIPDEDRFMAPAQGEIQAMAMSAEQEAYQRGQLVFTDRCVIDYPIYVSAMGDANGSLELMRRAQPWMHKYLRIYLLDPAGIQFKQTTERRENAETRAMLHREYLSYLRRHNISYRLLIGSVEKRMSIVDSELKDLSIIA